MGQNWTKIGFMILPAVVFSAGALHQLSARQSSEIFHHYEKLSVEPLSSKEEKNPKTSCSVL